MTEHDRVDEWPEDRIQRRLDEIERARATTTPEAEIRADGGVSVANSSTRPAHVGIDEATLTRDRRAAEQPMGTWPVAPGMWKVGTGSSDYSEYTVDVRDGRCTCSDWRFRGNSGSGKITRCKHLARVGMVLELLHPPADADVEATLVAQRERFSE